MDGSTLQFAQVMIVVVMSTAGFVGIALGARILWRMGSRQKPLGDSYRDDGRMQRLELAVDSIAIEVERISESQRFMVGLMSESLPARRAELGASAGKPERVNTPH
ncbi:MAG: hypothetical protein ACJ8AD_09250 [Gemmatimonadaceae bacterium]